MFAVQGLEFCGTNTVVNPRCNGNSAEKRTIGYFEAWGVGRSCDALFPEQIRASAYTHINFAFAFIDPVTFAVAPMSPGDPDLYRRLIALKAYNPGLQIWISFGGWTFTDDDQPTRHTFSDLAANVGNQLKFFASLLSFMSTYGFDGIDIDWEYPAADDRNGRPEDFANFVTLMRNLRAYLASTGHRYGVTVTLPTSFWYLQHFDVVNLEKHVDWFNIMSYDLAGTWDAQSIWRGPYVRAHTNLTEIDQALKLLWRNNINPANIVLGLGFYGRSFTLADPSCKSTGCPFSQGGPPGECTGESGTLSYSEILRRVQRGARPILDPVAAVQTLVYDNSYWVSYDDATTFKMKYDYANSNCLGGMMVWAASLDTLDGQGASALRRSQVANPNAVKLSLVQDTTSSCVWTNCGASCPSGYSPAAMNGGGQATSGRRCPKGSPRLFCCPSNNLPTCEWNLYQNGAARTFKVCQKKCASNQIAVGTDTNSCSSGHGTLCCENKNSVSYIDQCEWTGEAPSCAGILHIGEEARCNNPNKPFRLTRSSVGDGGERACVSSWKSLCCTNPPPYKNCAWHKSGKWYDWLFALCDGTCPPGKTVVAIDAWAAGCTGWGTGPGAFCCDPPNPPGSNTNPDSPTNPELIEWEATVRGWITAGSCQQTPGSGFKLLRMRELQSNATSLTARQQTLPSWTNIAVGAKLLLIIHQAGNNGLYASMGAIWDRVVQGAGDAWKSLTIDNIKDALDAPVGDPNPYINQILCDRLEAAATVQILRSQQEICVIPGEGPAQGAKRARSFTLNFNSNHIVNGNGQPGAGRLLQQITSDRLRPEYYRWFRYQNSGQFELEVVYLLGSDATHLDNSVRQIISNANGPPQDAFVIFHVHIERFGRYGLQVTQINIRHSPYMRPTFNPQTARDGIPTANNPSPGQWRAQSQNGVTRGLPVFACEVGRVWEIGIDDWVLNLPRNPPQEQVRLIQSAMHQINSDFDWFLNGALIPEHLQTFLTTDGQWNPNGRSSSLSYDRFGQEYNPFTRGFAGAGFIDPNNQHT
ncbi:hypothetical protein TWF506_003540 [Arthrobotrys conoides]|uniref:chitinase n=1 Tax=Arthrobotrys conoides TaxID=74498 RepID=A0AAN8RQG3_9PEZI